MTSLPAILATAFRDAGTPAAPERDRLVQDIETLAGTMQSLFNARQLLVRLEVVSDDACRKFHIDSVKACLIVTYRGPGTQYRFDDDESIEETPRGAVLLLRGKRWPGEDSCTLRHRSPPIVNETRLVLVVDPLY